jgi:hypothetical protein
VQPITDPTRIAPIHLPRVLRPGAFTGGLFSCGLTTGGTFAPGFAVEIPMTSDRRRALADA